MPLWVFGVKILCESLDLEGSINIARVLDEWKGVADMQAGKV